MAQQIRQSETVAEVLVTLKRYNESIAPLGNSRESLKQSFDPCPFLNPRNQCSVYEARPVICRAFHSTDVATCESIIKNSSSQRDVPMFTGLFGFRGLRLSGARKALKDMGLDDRPVVLARAVALLLENFEETLEVQQESASTSYSFIIVPVKSSICCEIFPILLKMSNSTGTKCPSQSVKALSGRTSKRKIKTSKGGPILS